MAMRLKEQHLAPFVSPWELTGMAPMVAAAARQVEEGTGLAPEDGMELLELSSLDLSVSENGGLDITASDGEHQWSVTLYPRTGVEEVGEL